MRKPGAVFDRQWEWDALSEFVSSATKGISLGVVSGRRRQGKSFLLQALCEAVGGFYYQAVQASRAESLRHFGSALAGFLKAPAPFSFENWSQAIDALLASPGELVVVLDEFPYAAAADPSLPSLLQSAIDSRRGGRTRSKRRIIICGSALSFMGNLLSGAAPLRGRAGLELIVKPFDYRDAARFWGLERHPQLALKVYSIVGGTPAYGREFVDDDRPAGPGDFDSWVTRAVLNPAKPLFREGRYLLAEEPGLRDPALYHSILAAIAEGNRTRGSIASAIRRPSTDIGHPLAVLEDAGLVRKRTDALWESKPLLEIAEPIIRFYHAVMRPVYGQLERPGSAESIWEHLQNTFASRVLGPGFEEVCREWTLNYSGSELFEGRPEKVGSTTVNDTRGRTKHEIDIVAIGKRDRNGRRKLLLLGEAKWGGAAAGGTARLRRVLDQLAARNDLDVSDCKLALFSPAKSQAPGRGGTGSDVVRIDANELFSGG